MRRRDVLALVGGIVIAWSLTAPAQQVERVRIIGVLIGLTEDDPESGPRIAAFRQGLQERGWTEGHNVRIHYRWTAEIDRLPALAKELVALQPDVLIASSTPVAAVLLRESREIPIVFVSAADPVGDGLVRSLSEPGGNATGFTSNVASMGGKWLELLKEISPGLERAAVMFNPDTAPGGGDYFLPQMESAALSLGVRLRAATVRNPADIEGAMAALGREPRSGLIVMPDNFVSVHRRLIIALAARYQTPAMYPFRYFATDGGLMSYGADLIDRYRQASSYIDQILKGATPATLPVQPPAKFDLVINLKAARQLGLTVPRIMLARADEVIE